MWKFKRPVLSILSALLICALLMVSSPVLDTLINPEGSDSENSMVYAQDDPCEGCSGTYDAWVQAKEEYERNPNSTTYQNYLAASNKFIQCQNLGCDAGEAPDSGGEPDPCLRGYGTCVWVWQGYEGCLKECFERYNACEQAYNEYKILDEKYGKCLECIYRCDVPKEFFPGYMGTREECLERYNACKQACQGDGECLERCNSQYDDCIKAYDEYIAFKAECDAEYQSYCEGDAEILLQKLIAANNKYLPLSTDTACTAEAEDTVRCLITLNTDKDVYEQGEAVTISGEVLCEGKPTPPTNNKVTILVSVPKYEVRTPLVVDTNKLGQFSIMPFAGHNVGEYTLRVEANVKSGQNGVDIEEEAKFEVVPPAKMIFWRANIDEIKRRYKMEVNSGPMRFDPGSHPSGVIYHSEYDEVFWGQRNVPESLYGSYHNMFIGSGPLDPGCLFCCGQYYNQVLDFLNNLRFNKDPKVRKLLRGFDYGPIARGCSSILALRIGYHLVWLFTEPGLHGRRARYSTLGPCRSLNYFTLQLSLQGGGVFSG